MSSTSTTPAQRLTPPPVLDAVIAHLELEARSAATRPRPQGAAVEHIYDAAATLIGCDRDEIAIVENATRAWDMAFYSFRSRPATES